MCEGRRSCSGGQQGWTVGVGVDWKPTGTCVLVGDVGVTMGAARAKESALPRVAEWTYVCAILRRVLAADRSSGESQ